LHLDGKLQSLASSEFGMPALEASLKRSHQSSTVGRCCAIRIEYRISPLSVILPHDHSLGLHAARPFPAWVWTKPANRTTWQRVDGSSSCFYFFYSSRNRVNNTNDSDVSEQQKSYILGVVAMQVKL